MKPNLKHAIASAQARMATHRARINAAENIKLETPYSGTDQPHGTITEVNASLLTEGTVRESLTAYAVGYRPGGNFEQVLEALAPGVPVAQRFDYKAFNNAEAFYSELTDDLRATGADFKSVEYTVDEVTAKTANRGLMISVDYDQVKGLADWETRYTGMLTTRLLLNKLRRALALLSAGATNTAKTWDATAGKNPDGDVRADLVTAHTAAGVRPNRVAYGPTAWSLRTSSHEAQDNAGGYAAAARTPEMLAAYLAIEQVIQVEARYSTSTTAKAEALSNLVLMFNAIAGATTEDPSNIKAFWSPCENGQMLQVHRWDVGPKKMCLAVEHYELIKLTSTLGIRKFTVS
jgi:hypothetical protein